MLDHRALREHLFKAAYRGGALSAFRFTACALDRALQALRREGRIRRGGLVFMFHRVCKAHDPFRPGCCPEQHLERFCQHLAEHYEVLPLADLEARRAAGADLSRCVALTFDDGYADNYWLAFPILKRYRFPATVFVTTEPLDGGPPIWTSRASWIVEHGRSDVDTSAVTGAPLPLQTRAQRASTAVDLVERLRLLEPGQRNALLDQLADLLQVEDFSGLRDEMLTWDQLRQMEQAGVTAQPHTLTHPILALLDEKQIEREVVGAKEEIEGKLNRPADLFAYPRGTADDFDQRAVDAVARAGYRAAYTVRFAPVRPSHDAFRLPRVSLYAETPAHMALQLERFFYLR